MAYIQRSVNNRTISRNPENRILQRTIGNLTVNISGSGGSITYGTTAPSSAPGGIGYIYINTTTRQAYFGMGTSSVSDWAEVGVAG